MSMKRRQAVLWGSAIAVTGFFVLRQAGGEKAMPTVKQVDLERYQGRWFEVARLPLVWENKCASDVTATYTLRADGKVDVLNQCRKRDGSMTRSHGRAKVAAGDGSNARLKVTFFWPFYGDYWILDLDPEYRWALVGTPNRKNLWVLSRTPKLKTDVLERLLRQAKELGFSTHGMIYTNQE
jgi:apolipoprotein D and lipocalin family protein